MAFGGVRELKARMTMDVRDFERGTKRAQSGLDGLAEKTAKSGGGLGLLQTAAYGVAMGGITMLATNVGRAVWHMSEMGLRALDVERNLRAFAGSAEAAESAIATVEEATAGTVNSMVAANTASRMLQMGIAKTNEEMALYAEGAVRLGDQTMSSSQRIGEMIALLKNLNINMLDNFGLSRMVVMGRVEELKATQGLTREEAMLLAIREEISRQLKLLGDVSDEGALNVDRLTASWENLKLSVGKGTGPILGGAIELLYGLSEAAQGNLDPLRDVNRSWAESLVPAIRRGSHALGQFVKELIRGEDPVQRMYTRGEQLSRSMGSLQGRASDLAPALDSLTGSIERGAAAMARYDVSMRAMVTGADLVRRGIGEVLRDLKQVTTQEAVGGYETAERTLTSRLMTIAGIVDPATLEGLYTKYNSKLLDLYQSTERLTEFELARRRAVIESALQKEISTYEDYLDVLADLHDKQLSAEEDLRSKLSGILQPTRVTQEDIDAGEAYQEKWDEIVRQMKAGAEGSERWLGLFPEDIRGDPAARQRYYQQYSKEFYRGLHPEDINLDAIKRELDDMIQDELGAERLLEYVAGALGLEGIELPVSLVPTTTGGQQLDDMVQAGKLMGEDVAGGFATEVKDLGVALTMEQQIREDVDANSGLLSDAGFYAWKAVEPGVITAIKKTEYAREIAMAVAPIVAQILDNRGYPR